jgi:TolB-like protein
MAEIFVSYARADSALVRPLVAALEAQGWSVWWDPAITTGQEFDRAISSELDAAKAVIVVWTPTSVESRWVRGEAREAASRAVLIPVRFDNARLPLDVRSLHTTDLDEWHADPASAPFQELLRVLRAKLGSPAHPQQMAYLAGSATPGNPSGQRRTERAKRSMLLFSAMGVLLLLGALGVFALRPAWFGGSLPRTGSQSTQSIQVRVAVLPFDVLSDSSAAHHFADGLTDEIISTLSANQMQTVSREDSVALRSTARDETLTKLNATFLFDGTVEEHGTDIQVRVHIDSTSDHGVLWSGTFTGAANEARTLQTEVATEAAGLIQMAIYAKSPGSAPIDNQTLATTLTAADDLRYIKPQEEQTMIQARQLAQQVVARAPDFAWGHSILSNAIGAEDFEIRGDAVQHQQARQGQRVEAERALALDPRDAMGYFGLSALATSARDFEAIILKGLSVDAHPAIFVGGLYGREAQLLEREGRLRDTLPYWRQGAALDPLSSWESVGLARTLTLLGQLAEAKTVWERCLTLWPSESGIRSDYFWSLVLYGDPKAALGAAHDPTTRPADLNEMGIKALGAFLDSRRAPTPEAKASAVRIIRAAAADHTLLPDAAVQMLAELGDIDGSLDVAMNRTRPLTQPSTLYSPASAKMRADPRFMDLAAASGGIEYWQSTGKWPDFCSEERLPYDCKATAARAATAAGKSTVH